MINKTDRLCFLGDSITDGAGTTKRYIEYIAEITGAEVHGFGVNGAQTKDVHVQLDRLEKTVGKNFDVLFLFIGTNDFNASTPLGEFFTERSESVPCNSDENGKFTSYAIRKKREFVFCEDTFKGRLNTLLDRIKKNYPDKRVIMLTPIHRAYAYFGEENIQPTELYSNAIGNYFEEYIDAERKAADVWSIELIDLYRDCGLFPLYDDNAELFFSPTKQDSLHPNENGHLRIAKTILNKI